MIVFIDRQHAGKPNKLDDRGASVDVDGDGKIDSELCRYHLKLIWRQS